MAEAVVQRGAQRFVAALGGVGVLDLLLAVAHGLDEGGDLPLRAQPLAHSLPGDHAQRQRVAGAVVQQRAPLADLAAVQPALGADLHGQGGRVGRAHARHGDALG